MARYPTVRHPQFCTFIFFFLYFCFFCFSVRLNVFFLLHIMRMFPHPSMSPDPCWKNMSLFPKARSMNITYIYIYALTYILKVQPLYYEYFISNYSLKVKNTNLYLVDSHHHIHPPQNQHLIDQHYTLELEKLPHLPVKTLKQG